MVEDMRGHLAELLAKAIDRKALDGVVLEGRARGRSPVPRPLWIARPQGQICSSGLVRLGIDGGGYAQAPVPLPALAFKDLAPSPAVTLPYLFEHIWDMQSAMLQPVGGMDRIAHAICEQVRPLVRLRSRGDGDPPHRRPRADRAGPGKQATEADYCVCTFGANLLARIPNDFSPAKKAALKTVNYLPSVKVGVRSAALLGIRRQIFGGLAWTDRANENVIYPSHEYRQREGVLVAAYVAGWTNRDNPQKFAAFSNAERLPISRESIEALHPGRSKLLSKGVSVGWGLVPYSEGVGALWPEAGGNGRAARNMRNC